MTQVAATHWAAPLGSRRILIKSWRPVSTTTSNGRCANDKRHRPQRRSLSPSLFTAFSHSSTVLAYWCRYGIKPDTAKPPLRALQVLDPNGTDHDGNPLPESAYTSGNGKVDTDGIRMTMYYYGADLGKTPTSGAYTYS